MLCKSQSLKFFRKQRKYQKKLLTDNNVLCVEKSTVFLAICNAGLSTGLQRETILAELIKHGQVKKLYMVPNKSYSFIECTQIKDAENIYRRVHGIVALGQNNSLLYLSYVNRIPKYHDIFQEEIPPGLLILEDFINEIEEQMLLKSISSQLENLNSLQQKAVLHYGYEFFDDSNQVVQIKSTDWVIPEEWSFLWNKLRQKIPNLAWNYADQITVTISNSGQDIRPHVDSHSAFLDPILTLSLESANVIEFNKHDKQIFVKLPQRSLFFIYGESYDSTYAMQDCQLGILKLANSNETIKVREKRTSLTFRKLRRTQFSCTSPEYCDSNVKGGTSNQILTEETAAKLEMENVHFVYDKIASHFSRTRHSPWPRVVDFMKSFEIGSIIVDVGCGNGKYLPLISQIFKFGCDRNQTFLENCAKQNLNVLKSDCMRLPLRSDSVNGCICIAVIHHLATESRRLKVVSEIARILQQQGRALIYVWAKNQEFNSKKSSYINRNRSKTTIYESLSNLQMQTQNSNHYNKPEINLPIHINRTQFQQQDMLVPWNLKPIINSQCNDNVVKNTFEKLTFLRYYHVFEENEIDNLCKKIKSISIKEKYYDEGNWCIIFEKL